MDTSSAVGDMLLDMVESVAEMERNTRSDRAADAIAPKRQNGVVYGPTPFGCQRAGTGITTSRLEHMRAARAEGLSLRAIADVLNAAEIPCKRGGARWYASTVRSIFADRIP